MKKLVQKSFAAIIVLSMMTFGLMLAGCGDDEHVRTATAPTAPVASAVGGFSEVTVSWNAVSEATSYNIYWSTTTGVTPLTGTKISNAASPFVQTGLNAAPASYYYVVTAANSVGESVPSAQVSATTTSTPPIPTIPTAPTGVSAVGGLNQVTVSWNAVSGATSYNIYWATASGVTKLSGSKLANVTSAYAHTGRTAATTYYYIISAVNSAGEGVASAQVSAAATSVAILPTAPTSVNATGGLNQVSVSWTAVSGASSYNIYWAQASGVTKLSGTKIANVTSAYVHTGRTAATTYFYIVTAVNSAGEGLASAQVSATATSAPTAPAAPTGVSGIGGANQVSISWTAVSGATSYNIYYSASSGVTTTNGTLIANATSPRIQTGLVAGTTYYFIVTAVNSTGEGAASTQASAATNATTTPACGSCHAIPPDLGAHSFHSHPCSTCHGTGYSSTTVNALTHNNGVKDVTISIWIPATRSCAAQCHNARAW